jgi:hypothetical protein
MTALLAVAIVLVLMYIPCISYISHLLKKLNSLRRGNLLLQTRAEKVNSENARLKAQVKYLYNAQETIVVEEPAVQKLQFINVKVLSITPNDPKEIK